MLRAYSKKDEQMRPNGIYRALAMKANDWIRLEAEVKYRSCRRLGQYAKNIKKSILWCSLAFIQEQQTISQK